MQKGVFCGLFVCFFGGLLNSEGSSEGCSKWVDSEVVGLSVHAWSLTMAVMSVLMIATIVVVVVLLLPL